jgi:hypothetical protein
MYYDRNMAQVDRFSVTMPPHVGQAVRAAAAREGASVSTWLTEAAADRLRNQLLGAALDAWEEEDGPFTDDGDPNHLRSLVEARGIGAQVVAV